MALTEFRKSCRNMRAGLISVSLAEAGDVVRVEYDAENDRYTAIEMKPGTGFVRFRFAEDEAEYLEKGVWNGGQVVVEHTLQFVLRGMDAHTRRSVEELADARNGLIALIESRQGVVWLAGYSEKFGLEQPLRLARTAGTTESKPDAWPAEAIVLRGVDTEKARPFTGEIPRPE